MKRALVLGLVVLGGCVSVLDEGAEAAAASPKLHGSGAPVFPIIESPDGQPMFVFESEDAPPGFGPIRAMGVDDRRVSVAQQITAPSDQPPQVVLLNADGSLCFAEVGRSWRFIRYQPDDMSPLTHEEVSKFNDENGWWRFAAEITGCAEASVGAMNAEERRMWTPAPADFAYGSAPTFAPVRPVSPQERSRAVRALSQRSEYQAARTEFVVALEEEYEQGNYAHVPVPDAFGEPAVMGWDLAGAPLLLAGKQFEAAMVADDDFPFAWGDDVWLFGGESNARVLSNREAPDGPTPTQLLEAPERQFLGIASFAGEWYFVDWRERARLGAVEYDGGC